LTDADFGYDLTTDDTPKPDEQAGSVTPVQGDPFLPSPSSGDTMSAYNPSWSESLGNAAQDALSGMGMSMGNAQDYGQQARNAASMTPLVGNVLSGNNAVRNYQQGNYGMAAIDAIGAIPIPGAGVVSRVGEGVVENAAEQAASRGAEQAAARGITAYHASPYNFDQFNMGKIGTGEGAQAFGQGMYFSDSPEVVQSYRDRFSTSPTATSYQVSLNANPEEFIDYNTHLSDQHPSVQAKLNQTPLWRAIDFSGTTMKGSDVMPRTARDMQDLANAGIPGMKYPAGTIGGKPSTASNYVVFNPNTISILKKYGLGSLGMVGAAEAASKAGESVGYQLSPVNGDPFVGASQQTFQSGGAVKEKKLDHKKFSVLYQKESAWVSKKARENLFALLGAAPEGKE
jgi:hypothetical protein